MIVYSCGQLQWIPADPDAAPVKRKRAPGLTRRSPQSDSARVFARVRGNPVTALGLANPDGEFRKGTYFVEIPKTLWYNSPSIFLMA